jgi:hypothetical protein
VANTDCMEHDAASTTGATRPAIRLDVTVNDSSIVKWYRVADKARELLAATIDEALHLPQTLRQDKSTMRWTAYLGTLLEETGTAVAQLLVLEMPRAAVILNRQVFEYGVRLSYLYSHPHKAEALLDSLPYAVWQEAKRAPGFFESELRRQYEENFRKWTEEHPDLDSQTTEQSFTPMAQEILGQSFNRDFFLHYSIPSIITHGKPQGIVDVLEMVEGNPIRHHNSRTADALSEFSKLAYYLLGAVRSIRQRYSLSMEPFNVACAAYNATFDAEER